MLTIAQEIKRLEQLLNGQEVEGLTLNDPGLKYDWVITRIANLRELQRAARRPPAEEEAEFGCADYSALTKSRF